MLKSTTIAAVATVFLAGFSGATFASENCTDQPKSKWLSQEAIAAKLKDRASRSRNREQAHLLRSESEGRQGKRVELYVDPVTARVVRQDSKDGS